jgi:hypothetical protein
MMEVEIVLEMAFSSALVWLVSQEYLSAQYYIAESHIAYPALYDDYCIFNNFIMTVNYHSFVIL